MFQSKPTVVADHSGVSRCVSSSVIPMSCGLFVIIRPSLATQSLVTNLNMEKQLNELSKAPIEIRLGFMQTPGLPKDGKCISLPRNLLPETQYVLSSSSGSRVSL
ncbi:hypothetical protein CTI12_AA322510 [Artemisia annua]|uniref:Uncharacterized protein n=1 Tax=Artemisia annua TaxID=35608 RepID=A0A2U1N0P5_ARTAN|nr:hypothetical protein CTI12_AA322510 [Artemisia annua]